MDNSAPHQNHPPGTMVVGCGKCEQSGTCHLFRNSVSHRILWHPWMWLCSKITKKMCDLKNENFEWIFNLHFIAVFYSKITQ